jgi:hypothetical protein
MPAEAPLQIMVYSEELIALVRPRIAVYEVPRFPGTHQGKF